LVITQKAVDSEIYRSKASNFLDSLDISYNDVGVYVLSFIHRSIVNERNDFAPEHNERLEFLGDAVLELVITHSLFQDFPEKQEWELTDMRSALVRGKNLALIAKNLWFSDFLFLWKGEEKSWGRNNDYILANTVEAFIGAIYTDLWFEAARDFIVKHVYSTLPSSMEEVNFKDYKTLLQEYTQAHMDVTPSYEVMEESWPDHDKKFLVCALSWDTNIWQWTGTSKKKAQESAAKDAYIKLTT